MPLFLLIFVVTLLFPPIAWFGYLGLFSSVKKIEIYKLFNQAIAVYLSAGLAFLAFFFQQQITSSKQREALQTSVIEELKIIKEMSSGATIISNACGDGAGVLPFLPHGNIQKAASSSLFDQYTTRHLLILESNLEEHNRWISFGDSNIFPSPGNKELGEMMRLFRLSISPVDERIFAGADFLFDCLTTGTSKRDPDCR